MCSSAARRRSAGAAPAGPATRPPPGPAERPGRPRSPRPGPGSRRPAASRWASDRRTRSARRPAPAPGAPPSTAIRQDSASTRPSTPRSVKPSVLSTASSPIRSRTDCAMVLPATSRMVKKTTATMAIRIAADVADLLGEALHEGPLGLGLGLGRRVGELGVDRRGDLGRPLGVVDPHDVPADDALAPGAGLVEVVVVEEEAGRVGALLGALVDAHEVELPAAAAVLLAPDRRLDRDPVADLPAEPLGGARGRRWRRSGCSATPRCSAGSSTYSGYISRNCSGSTGIWAKKFFGSW